jgi:hypothetical protein
MKTRKPTMNGKSALVWRISAESPEGKWVDPTRSGNGPTMENLPEVSHGGWASSTFDLLRGADVSDDPDTVPSALLDELFSPKKDSSAEPDVSGSSEQGGRPPP